MIILIASGQEQELVLVYAVAVFVSFLAGLLAMARFTHRRGETGLAALNVVAAVVVAFTLIVNLLRGYPLISMAATVLIGAGLYWRWVRAGRPLGLEESSGRPRRNDARTRATRRPPSCKAAAGTGRKVRAGPERIPVVGMGAAGSVPATSRV